MATLIAPFSTDPIADAQALRKACEGWGTDEKGIIEVIGHRNEAQLKLIREAYTEQYGEDLIRRFEKELSGDLEKAVYRWMHEPLDRQAILANVAVKKGDYKVIVELSCLPCSEEFLGIRRAYQARYKHSLEEDVASHSTGEIRRLLLLLVSAYRHETKETDARLAEAEAEILHKAIKDKEFSHDEVLRIVGTRSKAQLVATFFRYQDVYGDSIIKRLEANKDKEFVRLLETTIECIWSTKEYLESVVREALSKKGRNEDVLTRVIVTRAERDLREIKELYYKRNSVTLEDAIGKEIRGDYKTFLLTLLGAEGY
uniref:Annexin n=1 Tax=Fagopyrum tataricum TaxID=62330 RepID=A0A0F7MWF8_FAGTA|nr:annexin [Fagopyrum tataricum]